MTRGDARCNFEAPEVVEDEWMKAGFLSNDEECLDHHRRRDDVGICCGTPPVFVSFIAAVSLSDMTRRLFIRTPSPSPLTAPRNDIGTLGGHNVAHEPSTPSGSAYSMVLNSIELVLCTKYLQ